MESLINPLEVVRYHSSDLTFFRVKHLAVAVSFHKEAVKSVHEIKRLLQFEPYAGLDLNTLQCVQWSPSMAATLGDNVLAVIIL